MRGWWQPQREVRYNWRIYLKLTIQEWEAVEYFRRNLKLGWGSFFRMLVWEWLAARQVDSIERIESAVATTWEKIQQHMQSGKWHGLPDKFLKVTREPSLSPKTYAAAAYAYGVHPELSKLLHDYGLELMHGKATGYLIENPVTVEKPKYRKGQME